MVEIYILKIENGLMTDTINWLKEFVSEEKKKRICSFLKAAEAQNTLLADVLARYALCKRLGVKNEDLVFGTNKYGKPVLLKPDEAHFNISHSGKWISCAVDDKSVGIDIEVIKPIDYPACTSILSKEECAYLEELPQDLKLKYFYMIWTLKESYVKMKGKGLYIPFNSFTIGIENSNIRMKPKEDNLFFYQSFLCDDVLYSVCTKSQNNPEEIIWNTDDFLKLVQNIRG